MLIKCKKKAIGNSDELAEVLIAILKSEDKIDRDKEHFWSIGLNCRSIIQYVELVSLGTLTASIVHPRETFGLAVMKRVASIIIAHNHPSGDPEPSEEDLLITKRLTEAGKILGIEVLDHIIISGKNHFSFNGKGLIK